MGTSSQITNLSTLKIFIFSERTVEKEKKDYKCRKTAVSGEFYRYTCRRMMHRGMMIEFQCIDSKILIPFWYKILQYICEPDW
jgi:hypothetical protein